MDRLKIGCVCTILVLASIERADATTVVDSYYASSTITLGTLANSQPQESFSCGSSIIVTCDEQRTYTGIGAGSAKASVSIIGGSDPNMSITTNVSSSESTATGILAYFFRILPYTTSPGTIGSSVSLTFAGTMVTGDQSVTGGANGVTRSSSASVTLYSPDYSVIYISSLGPQGPASGPVTSEYSYTGTFVVGPEYEVLMYADAQVLALTSTSKTFSTIDPTLTLAPEYLDLYQIVYSPGLLEGVAAAPEASTWAMTLLGFGGCAFMAYRRRSGGMPAADRLAA